MKPKPLPPAEVEADDIRPPAHRVIAERLNRIATGINELHAELSDLRHELGVAERYSEPRDNLARRHYER